METELVLIIILSVIFAGLLVAVIYIAVNPTTTRTVEPTKPPTIITITPTKENEAKSLEEAHGVQARDVEPELKSPSPAENRKKYTFKESKSIESNKHTSFGQWISTHSSGKKLVGCNASYLLYDNNQPTVEFKGWEEQLFLTPDSWVSIHNNSLIEYQKSGLRRSIFAPLSAVYICEDRVLMINDKNMTLKYDDKIQEKELDDPIYFASLLVQGASNFIITCSVEGEMILWKDMKQVTVYKSTQRVHSIKWFGDCYFVVYEHKIDVYAMSQIERLQQIVFETLIAQVEPVKEGLVVSLPTKRNGSGEIILYNLEFCDTVAKLTGEQDEFLGGAFIHNIDGLLHISSTKNKIKTAYIVTI